MTQKLNGLDISKHALGRMRQRGFTNHDLALVCSYGTPVGEGFLMTHDAVRDLCSIPKERQRAERLRGAVAIVEGGTVVTVFHDTKRWRKGQTRPTRRSRQHLRISGFFTRRHFGAAA
jgi:hypothetical protein